jgi:phosphate transport system protein
VEAGSVSPDIHPSFILLSQNLIMLALPRNQAEGGEMATQASKVQTIYQDVLANYLISMARTVESSVESALDALLRPNREAATELSSKVFLVEPRVNEMEILIDDHAVRMLRTGLLDDEEIRRVVASQKIANDLERIGDLAVNISERVISLAGMNVTETPRDLEPMAGAVRGMLGRSLGALIFRNVVLAGEVLESDDVVDRYRDQIFEHLLARMTDDPRQAAPQLQFILATRYLERIADHSTNIAEDIIFWVRGLDVRHGRARMVVEEANYPEKRS